MLLLGAGARAGRGRPRRDRVGEHRCAESRSAGRVMHAEPQTWDEFAPRACRAGRALTGAASAGRMRQRQVLGGPTWRASRPRACARPFPLFCTLIAHAPPRAWASWCPRARLALLFAAAAPSQPAAPPIIFGWDCDRAPHPAGQPRVPSGGQHVRAEGREEGHHPRRRACAPRGFTLSRMQAGWFWALLPSTKQVGFSARGRRTGPLRSGRASPRRRDARLGACGGAPCAI